MSKAAANAYQDAKDALDFLEGEVHRLETEASRRSFDLERLRGVVAKARGHIEVMRECAEASLEHLEGLHRVPAARAVRQADRALAELEAKPMMQSRFPKRAGEDTVEL